MDISNLSAMASAASMLFSASTLFYLVIGVGIGTLLSVIPGVGGLMGIALLLPFTFSMGVNEAMAFLLGALAVMSTADTIPAVLFGVPGTPTSMVTVLDGHPMAKRGEAGRALGAAFASSVFGGVLGALVLFLVIPVVMPLLMGTTSAELLGLCIMGLAMVAALSGGSMIKGLGAAAIGIMLAFIGDEPTTAISRWTFGSLYLTDGINLLVIALGIYALPEVADLAIQGRSIASEKAKASGVMKGARTGLMDTLRNWKLVGSSSIVSTMLGALPAVGPTIIPWMVYSMVTKFTRGPSTFGKGDVRGVIASESSNNATVGGALLPTVAVGVPGSAPMALFLGGMLLHGVAPGPDMLTKNLNLTYMMVWAIVLANVIGGVVAYALAGYLARVVFVRAAILVPMISSVLVVGAVQSSRQWQDLLFLLVVGILGWVMKRARWSRAPMFLAFILAPLIERYFHISTNLHGLQWMTRPAVAVMLAITVVFLLGVAISHTRKSLKQRVAGPRQLRPVWNLDVGFAFFVLACSVVAWSLASGWPADARMLPQVAVGFAGAMAVLAVWTAWWQPVPVPASAAGAIAGTGQPAAADDDMHFDLETDFGGMTRSAIALGAVKYIALLACFGLLAWVIGVVPAIPVYLLGYLLLHRERLWLSAVVAIGAGIFTEVVFNRVLSLAWPPALWPLW